MAEQWTPVEGSNGPFVKFEKMGDEVAGKITGRRISPARDGFKEQLLIDIETPEGPKTIGCSSDLKTKLSKVPDTHLVQIKFVATKKTGKPQPMKVFDVKSRPSPGAQ